MVDDTSAILAIFWREPEHHQSLELLRQADSWPFSRAMRSKLCPCKNVGDPLLATGGDFARVDIIMCVG